MKTSGAHQDLSRSESIALAALILVAVAQRAWNAYSLPPLIGYDEPGHAGYILTILEDGRLPHPTEGWSTFHPPLFYLLGSVVWRWLDPFGPHAVVAGLRGIGSLAGVAAGLVSYALVRRLGGTAPVAWVAAALVLFVPCAQMAGAMVGNEALAAGLAALVLPLLLTLQHEPRKVRVAALAGFLAGLALCTKFTAVSVAAACAVPFLRTDFDRAMLRSLAIAALSGVVVAGPVYLRNFALTGSVVPMTREIGPMRKAEANLVLRPREIGDYLWIDPDCLLRPSIFQVPNQKVAFRNRNPSMTSVWGLTYASLWWDPFANRTPLRFHRDGVWFGPAMMLAGLAPTLVLLLGFATSVKLAVGSRGRSLDAPLVVMALAGLAMFVAFTWKAPSMAAVKGSYLLALAAPAGVFFASGASLLGARARGVVLALSLVAVLAAAVMFTNGLLFWSPAMGPGGVAQWQSWGAKLPGSHIAEALRELRGPP